ncbi:MAG: hypothetical protein FJ134_12390 [Deltaproteobacteria bacterium]|nr:hypothetical protein [Deltaproteobacteria bacterium]
MQVNIDVSILDKFVTELRMTAEKCPRCEGSRETIFTSRGRDNVVPCLECENIHNALENLEAA